jgi:hypothetical protein
MKNDTSGRLKKKVNYHNLSIDDMILVIYS